MASLKDIKERIASVSSTRKITSAMKMVASAKLHKAQSAIENMLPYERKLNAILTNLLAADGEVSSPYTQQRKVERVALVVLSSNSSLCGAYNANVIRLLGKTLQEYKHLPHENILIYSIGRKVSDAVRKFEFTPAGDYRELADKPLYKEAANVAAELMQLFVEDRVDKVELIYHHFKSMASQLLVRENFLPLDLHKQTVATPAKRPTEEEPLTAEKFSIQPDYILEPSREELLATLLPKVLSLKIYTILLDSNASEHAARTIAMQTATDNATDLIQELTILYNKSRQQAITNELLDIIGGSMN